MSKHMNNISLRVFKRDHDAISILWEKEKLPLAGNEDRINFIVSKNNCDPYEAQVILKPDSKKNLPTELAIVEHRPNNLRHIEEFDLSFLFDGNCLATIYVYAAGVKPDHEKDKKEKNVHLMLWDQENNTWRKAVGVDTEHGFALLTVPVDSIKGVKEEE